MVGWDCGMDEGRKGRDRTIMKGIEVYTREPLNIVKTTPDTAAFIWNNFAYIKHYINTDGKIGKRLVLNVEIRDPSEHSFLSG